MNTEIQINKTPHILIADDDNDDRQIIKDALRQSIPLCTYSCAEDGEDTLEFLYHQGRFANTNYPPVDLILLDLKYASQKWHGSS